MTKRWRRVRRVGGSIVLALAAVAGVATTGQAMPAGGNSQAAVPARVQVGGEPPQFIVVSWDGGGSIEAWRTWRDVGRRVDADMTFFLSGLYLLPEDKRMLYRPPRHPAGSSEIGFAERANVRPRMEEVRQAYLEGHEIGSHFNGHFCGPGGVQRWSYDDWVSENRQWNRFLLDWRENAGATDAAPMPFGLDAIVGERTPCLQGDRSALLPMLADHGFRYDTSGIGGLRWPTRFGNGLWNIPLQNLRMAGSGRPVLSMDYNFYEAQSGATDGPASRYPAMRRQVLDTYRNAYRAVYDGNRAPLILGNHFNTWNGGIYRDALETFLLETCQRPETRCVSSVQLVDWMEAQTPDTRARLAARPAQAMRY